MQRHKPLAQLYSAYTTEDFQVWQLLFKRQMNLLRPQASKLYLKALEDIGFNGDEIPHFEKMNKRLESFTGWKVVVAPELVPQREFFQLLSQKIFPATCWLRTMAELDYIEEPDMFHDVFGHVPLLTNEAYADFMEGFGKLAMKWIDVPEIIALLGRVYWFTIEFGLLHEKNMPKIFGAGIISSPGETANSLSDASVKLSFDITQMLSTDYRTDILQPVYFTIKSFEQLCAALPEIEKSLAALTYAEKYCY
ncbi:phenylalanine 4-monooxygenase [Taibaiella soli]|uniref:Phenylalanine 4-monooxygenase n=1 Tax=Taibaiella soli TaxID=1649169 RepID=A0A2W2BDX9_9BACT|nr:phenylalanine 4-monooxygenase [Taibaiella soli]PZF71796.1 phenylalanine 4-monooxygenase [Taibaiella soli]